MTVYAFAASGFTSKTPAFIGWRDGLPCLEVAEEVTAIGDRWRDDVTERLKRENPEEPTRTRRFLAGFELGTRCAYCLRPTDSPERDHIVPFSKGGTESYDNIVPACRSCNARKHDMSLLEFVAVLNAPEFELTRPRAVAS